MSESSSSSKRARDNKEEVSDAENVEQALKRHRAEVDSLELEIGAATAKLQRSKTLLLEAERKKRQLPPFRLVVGANFAAEFQILTSRTSKIDDAKWTATAGKTTIGQGERWYWAKYDALSSSSPFYLIYDSNNSAARMIHRNISVNTNQASHVPVHQTPIGVSEMPATCFDEKRPSRRAAWRNKWIQTIQNAQEKASRGNTSSDQTALAILEEICRVMRDQERMLEFELLSCGLDEELAPVVRHMAVIPPQVFAGSTANTEMKQLIQERLTFIMAINEIFKHIRFSTASVSSTAAAAAATAVPTAKVC